MFETSALAEAVFAMALWRYMMENPGFIHWRKRPTTQYSGDRHFSFARLHTHKALDAGP